MSDEIRRIQKEHQHRQALLQPYDELKAYLESTSAIYKRLAIDPPTMTSAQADAERILRQAALGFSYPEVDPIRQEIENQLRSGPLEEFRRLRLDNPTADIRRSLGIDLDARSSYEQLFRLPLESEIHRLAQDAAGTTSLTRALFGTDTSLEAAMAKMHSPWLQHADGAASAAAFAELVGIGFGIERNDPFDAFFSAELRPLLGDWRNELPQSTDLVDPLIRTRYYQARGFDSSLTDFPPLAFAEGLRIAGLSPPEQAGDDEDETDDENVGGSEIACQAFLHLRRFEIIVRRFIVKQMSAKFGEGWATQRVASLTLQAWKDKKSKDPASKERDLPLIDYADFSDYLQIIERNDNWRDVFQSIFHRKEDVQESFRRLGPIRISTMHSRLVLPQDHLLLLSETKRVIRVIRATSSQA